MLQLLLDIIFLHLWGGPPRKSANLLFSFFFGLLCSSSNAKKHSGKLWWWVPSKPYKRGPKVLKIREKYIQIIIF